jgi:isopentenyl diphosphate isomerase/L-lactate dehydrogenase-like FMN-dependent dehydrogenase
MNVLQIIAIIKLLIESKEEILDLIKLIQSLFAAQNLIGADADATVIGDSASFPVLAAAVNGAGMNWAEFVKLLIDNLDEIKELVSSILEVLELFKK